MAMPKPDRGAVRLVVWGLFAWGGYACSPEAKRTAEAMQELRALPLRSLADTTEGPGWFHGHLVGPAVVSPLGRPAVLWVLEGMRQGEDRREHVCFDQPAKDLELESDGHRVQVQAPDNLGETWFLSQLGDKNVRHKMPSPIPWQCRGSGPLIYREVAIPAGAMVWVSGCMKKGVLGACPSGYDGLTTGSRFAWAAELVDRIAGVSDSSQRLNPSESFHPLLGLFLLLRAALLATPQEAIPPSRDGI